ncbi:hypothetical protein [Lactococcus lactis]|uniref:hypothetical protein n=1 Tax=Lactococcus lactis TaxID=1358 RepID=UPI003F9E6D73
MADYADYVYLLEKGHIISCGTPSDVFQEVDFLKAHELGVPKATHFADQLQKQGSILLKNYQSHELNLLIY